MGNRNQTLRWIEQLGENKIRIEKSIINQTKNRGIYGIFIIDKTNEVEYCVYVGRANNIYSRMFSSGGHLVKLKNDQEIQSLCDALKDNNKIIDVRVLETVEYTYENYYKDAQRLASAENKYIDKYQAEGQCLEQLPDGSNIEQEVWLKEKNTIFL